jgi:hypothetical protein
MVCKLVNRLIGLYLFFVLGAFGVVSLVKEKDSGQLYAMKQVKIKSH